MINRGFTLIELVIVIVLLSLLSFVAMAKIMNLHTDARINVITSLRGTLISAQDQLYARAQMPNALLPGSNTDKGQMWLDMNRNGLIDADSNNDQMTFEGKDGEDILLMSSLMIDNHQLLKIVMISDELTAVLGPEKHQAYIGYDRLKNGDIKAGNCRVYYDQVRFQMRTDGC